MKHLNASVVGGFAAGIFTALVVFGLAVLVVAYSGIYNIAATEQHLSLTRWVFDTTFENSIERHAENIKAPEKLTPEMVASGASSYKSMCQH